MTLAWAQLKRFKKTMLLEKTPSIGIIPHIFLKNHAKGEIMRGEHVLIVKDEGNLRRYFIQVPNIIDDTDTSVHAFRLYVHLKRVAGDDGKCWQSVRTLSKACNMSKGTITKARQELEDLELINVLRKDNPHGGRKFIEISIKDIWVENFKRYSKQPSTHKPSVESPSYTINTKFVGNVGEVKAKCNGKK